MSKFDAYERGREIAAILQPYQKQIASGDPNQGLDPNQKAQLEKLIGRPLSLQEEISGVLDGRDRESIRADLLADGFSVVMPEGEQDDALTVRLKELATEIEEEQFARLSPAEREFKTIQKAQLESAKREETDKLLELERQSRAPLVAQLQALADEMRCMPNVYSHQDLMQVEAAILQLETVGSDTKVAASAMANALSLRDSKITEAACDADSRLSELADQLQGFKSRHGLTQHPAPPEPEPSVAEGLQQIANETAAMRYRFEERFPAVFNPDTPTS